MGSPLKGTLWRGTERARWCGDREQDGEEDGMQRGRWSKRSGEGKVLEGLRLAGAYYERSGVWVDTDRGWGEERRRGEASNGFGHFSPPIRPGPAESRLSIFNAIMSRQVWPNVPVDWERPAARPADWCPDIGAHGPADMADSFSEVEPKFWASGTGRAFFWTSVAGHLFLSPVRREPTIYFFPDLRF